ncbi:uncharacterized protein LOC114523918 [Dendronephthya gigantea]|uniref:uncharacterized protein LOC114523918 n=1 Tax=Dendronephthya gigantea TaxID=151771 RepID=UPI00106A2467|nr:uncharacterized protein LOC114523918 [Dendronephthya gigantea]
MIAHYKYDERLGEGVVIIDSPALGETDEMDEVLMNYLQNALALIYVLDTSRAGGVQQDIKEKLKTILKKVKSSDAGVETLQHLAECSLFICNKWDQVEEDERKIEKQEQEVKKDMAERVEYHTKVLLAKLEEYIHSMDFKTKFCTWDNGAFPPHGITWEVTRSNVNMAIDNRFKELLIEWENDHQVYAEIHRQLLDEFRTRLNLLEEELQGVDKAMHSVERQADYLKNRSKISTTTKVIFGATSPLWIPFGVAGLVIGMPVLGAMAVKRKVTIRKKFDNYQNNPRDYLKKESEKYLERLPKEYVLEYANARWRTPKWCYQKWRSNSHPDRG